MAVPEAAPRLSELQRPAHEFRQVWNVLIAPTSGPRMLAMAAGCEDTRTEEAGQGRWGGWKQRGGEGVELSEADRNDPCPSTRTSQTRP
eukprot:380372-Rhodomonas_salina.12